MSEQQNWYEYVELERYSGLNGPVDCLMNENKWSEYQTVHSSGTCECLLFRSDQTKVFITIHQFRVGIVTFLVGGSLM
jgi:hypothetical protein